MHGDTLGNKREGWIPRGKADSGDSHIHTTAKEEAINQSVFAIQGVIVLEVIFRQLNWFLVT